jgi:CBS domain containing-hemolysin-like protein
MDIPPRVVAALSIVLAALFILAVTAILRIRKRRIELPRRRGVKSYNRTGKASGGS